MPDITITFQEEGDEQIGFRIPAAVAEKMDAFIAERNSNAVLGGPAYAGKADWFTKECYYRILKPVLDRFPDPPPEEAQLKLSQAAVLQQEAAQIIAKAAVQPFIPIKPEPTEPTEPETEPEPTRAA
jgi:hypothetical protein